MLWIGIILFLAQSSFCYGYSENGECARIMSDAGLDVDTFNDSVSHGIHSLTVEHLNYFFEANTTEDNKIPTVNTNFSGPAIIPHAPKISDDPESKSLLMKLIDFIMAHNDDVDNFMLKGLSSIEKFVHAAHMNELYVRAQPIYFKLRRNKPSKKQVCPCVVDEKGNGILFRLKIISDFNRSFTFKLPFDQNIGLGGRKLGKYFPRLVDSKTWVLWKLNFRQLTIPEKGIFNLAYYLYCKLNDM